MSSFTSSLLASDPPITGLDESIIIPARRLHLTLGVMSLDNDSSNNTEANSLSDALSLLESLKPRLLSILDGSPLQIPFEVVDIMKPPRGGASNAHVMYIGPDPHASNGVNTKLRMFCGTPM